jgi:hypothetical protein
MIKDMIHPLPATFSFDTFDGTNPRFLNRDLVPLSINPEHAPGLKRESNGLNNTVYPSQGLLFLSFHFAN